MAGQDSLHIVVFPWFAFGHILPFLELSKSLAKRGHYISFISTARTIQRLPKIPSEISHLINFISFRLPKIEGLPTTAEATYDVAPECVERLKTALDGLEQPFRKFIEEHSPKRADWIIQDFAQHWIPQIAKENNVPCAFFSIFSSATQVFFYNDELTERTKPEQLLVPPPWLPFHSNLAYRCISDARNLVDYGFKPNSSGFSDMYRGTSVVKFSDAIVTRSSREFEPEWLELLPQLYKKPVIPIGLLLPSPLSDKENEKREKDKIIEWLDKHRSRSVVYIAFGSEAVLSDKLTRELAFGLELAMVPFVWALRWPESMLPEGFEVRTKVFGVVTRGWVPQPEILAHESIGGFVTHVGWSSIIEGLQFGHPFIMLPAFVDQGLIARVMEAKGVGIEVERGYEDGYFTKEAVAKVLKLVMEEGDEGGNPWRKKANEIMRQAFSDKDRQEKYIDEFSQYLQSHHRSKTNEA